MKKIHARNGESSRAIKDKFHLCFQSFQIALATSANIFYQEKMKSKLFNLRCKPSSQHDLSSSFA